MTLTQPADGSQGDGTFTDPVPLDEALPSDVAVVVADIVPGVHARRAGRSGRPWKMWGRPMFQLLDSTGEFIGLCTRTVIWSDQIADQVARRVDCPVEDSPYGRAVRLSGRVLAAERARGDVGACGMEHAVSGACPTGRCD